MTTPRLPPIAAAARRRFVLAGASAACMLAAPSIASSRRVLPAMTEGPFYPQAVWRHAQGVDWDADLTVVAPRRGGDPLRARGEVLDLEGVVTDVQGRLVDGVEIEIWQCDALGSYRHPRGAGAQVDEGFQGFGATRTDAQGRYRFRTIRPVPYPGRTPHIHVKLRHPTWGEWTSQWFVAGDPGNAHDFIYRRLSTAEQAEVDLSLQRASPGAGATWWAQRRITVG
jgi:protocatechuate 3,4-dioxygenase beta subunit